MDKRKQRLRELLDEYDIQSAFAERAGMSPSMLSQYVSTGPSSRAIGEKVARRFEEAAGKPNGWLDGVDFSAVTMREGVPLISLVQAGAFDPIDDPYPPGSGEEWIYPVSARVKTHTFALRVDGV